MDKTTKVCSIELNEIGLTCKFLDSESSPFQGIIADNGGNIYLHNFESIIIENGLNCTFIKLCLKGLNWFFLLLFSS